MLETGAQKGGVRHISISGYREVDIQRTSGFLRVNLHRDTPDQRVRDALAFEEFRYETKRLLLGISAR